MTHINWFTLSSSFGAATCLYLAWFSFSRNRSSALNRWYAVILVCMAGWCVDSMLISSFHLKQLNILHNILYVIAIFSQYSFVRWIPHVKGGENKFDRIFQKIAVSLALLLTFLSLSNNLTQINLNLNFTEKFLKPSKFYPLFIFYVVSCALYGMISLKVASRKLLVKEKLKVNYIFYATVVMYAAGTTYFFFIYGLPVWPIADLFVTLSNLVITYAIVKHQLMDIEVIVRRTAVFAGLFAFVYGAFTVVSVLGQEFFKNSLGWNQWVAMIPTVAIITFSLRPLENFLTNVTEKFLFQKKYDYRELLKLFTNEVLMIVDLQKLTEQTIAGLNNIIKIESAAVFLHDKDAKTYKLVAGIGTKEKDIKFDEKSLLVSFLKSTQHPIVKDKSVDSMESGELKESFRRMNAQVSLPIASHDDLIGILSLGMKKSGEDYTQDDLDILGSLARTLGIAIRNAQLFDEQGKTQAVAAQAEKMAVIGTLASGINHEICNPLGIVRGQSEMFLLNYKDGFYKEKTAPELLKICADIMQKIIKETDRATAITKKLSSFAKPSKKGDFEDVYIDKEIDEVIGLVGHDLKINNIEFKKEFSPNFPAIHADKKQMQEVLFNIIRNAAQAIEGLKQSGKISVTGVAEGSMAGIYISDTGGGIPPDKIGQIFNPFYTTKAPGKGTGLGLFIVKQVVERNKGSILVESDYGVGTTFILKFPISDLAVAA